MYKVDVYLRVRRAVMVDGMSMREAARTFGLHRDTVRKMLAYSVAPGYRRQTPPRRPKLEPYTGVIDRTLEDDLRRPRKQRHTAKRILERQGRVRFRRRIHHAQGLRQRESPSDQGDVRAAVPSAGSGPVRLRGGLVVIGDVEQKAHCFVIDLPQSDGCFVKAYPQIRSEASQTTFTASRTASS